MRMWRCDQTVSCIILLIKSGKAHWPLKMIQQLIFILTIEYFFLPQTNRSNMVTAVDPYLHFIATFNHSGCPIYVGTVASSDGKIFAKSITGDESMSGTLGSTFMSIEIDMMRPVSYSAVRLEKNCKLSLTPRPFPKTVRIHSYFLFVLFSDY